MTVLDVKCILDIERYRKIEVNATKPEVYFGPQALAPQRNTRFLERCVRQFTMVDLASRETGLIYPPQGLTAATHDPSPVYTKTLRAYCAHSVAYGMPRSSKRRKPTAKEGPSGGSRQPQG